MKTPLEEWQEDPKLAADLANLLKHPTLSRALKIVGDMTMAKTLHKSNILEISKSAGTLFGYDMGRISILEDLKSLSIESKEIKSLKATYQS